MSVHGAVSHAWGIGSETRDATLNGDQPIATDWTDLLRVLRRCHGAMAGYGTFLKTVRDRLLSVAIHS